LATSILVIAAVFISFEVARAGRRVNPPVVGRFQTETNWRAYVADGRRMGAIDAKVVLVEFSDFQCPWCRTMASRLREARERFGGDFAVVYRHYPIVRTHPFARKAAIASECAAEQGRFEQMHDALFESADSIGAFAWARFAIRAGLADTNAFTVCMESDRASLVLQRDSIAAAELGVRGTPTSLINGVRFAGALDQATLDSLIAAAVTQSQAQKR
jgi:protein-disulfide isomerase